VLTTPRFVRRAGAALFAAFALAASAAPAANAGVLVESAPDCTGQVTEQPFARWGDNARYTLIPGGDFENGAQGWSLRGAYVRSGNEPYYVRGAGDSHSLQLPRGSSAVTPTVCVGLEHPTMRFFVREQGTLTQSVLSNLAVTALVETELGAVVPLPVGVVLGSSSFRPSAKQVVLASLLPLLPGEHTPIRFVFTPIGGASWQIDDVYLDPRRMG
jgi:hypothetical protein